MGSTYPHCTCFHPTSFTRVWNGFYLSTLHLFSSHQFHPCLEWVLLIHTAPVFIPPVSPVSGMGSTYPHCTCFHPTSFTRVWNGFYLSTLHLFSSHQIYPCLEWVLLIHTAPVFIPPDLPVSGMGSRCPHCTCFHPTRFTRVWNGFYLSTLHLFSSHQIYPSLEWVLGVHTAPDFIPPDLPVSGMGSRCPHGT